MLTSRLARAEGGGTGARAAPVPRYVWAATGLLLGLLLLHAHAAPLYQAPDEPEHVDAVLLVLRLEGWPLGIPMDNRVVVSRQASGFDQLPLPAADAPPRGERPSLDELHPGGPSSLTNQMTQHPPLYYALLAPVAAALLDAGHDTLVGGLRLVNVLMMLPVPLLAYLASRRVSPRREVHVVATLLPLAVPQFTHIGAVVNNDNLLVLLLSVLTVLLLAVVDRPRSYGLAAGAGVVAGLALLTKGFALVALPWIALAYGLAVVGRRARAVGQGAVALGLAAGIGGWWWLRNLLLHGEVQPYGIPIPDQRVEGFAPDAVGWAAYFLSHLALRFWGSLAWFDVDLPWSLVRVATALVLGGVLLAAVASLRGRGIARAHVALALYPTVALLAVVAAGSWERYVGQADLGGIQGRYLFGGLVGLAVLAAAGLAAPSLARVRALLLPLAAATGVALQAVALLRMLRHSWGEGPGGDLTGQVAAMLAWSPWPPAVAAAAVLLTVAGIVAVAVTVLEDGMLAERRGAGRRRERLPAWLGLGR